MRHVVLALLMACALALIGAVPAAAVGTHSPFCMQGNAAPALSDCSYASYEQCQATASGRFLYCIANPYYNPGEPYPRNHRRHYRERAASRDY